MFLADAVKEKDYLDESISKLCSRIQWLSITTKETDSKLNEELINNKLEELDNLYKEYQKYSIIITRAKATIKLKLNDGEFSIADAENLVAVLKDKLVFFERLTSKIEGSNTDPSNIICLDLKEMDTNVRILREDIKAIEHSIQNILWSDVI